MQWSGNISTKITNNDTDGKQNDINEKVIAKLLIELTIKLSEANDNDRKYMAMRLISNLFPHLQRPEKKFVSKPFDPAMQVLSVLRNYGINEILRTAPNQNDEIPLDEFARNDLNKLLRSHRTSLKQKATFRDDAIHARKETYKLIPHLVPYIFERSDASRFPIPILLLQCAALEDRCLENYLLKALDATLVEYKKKLEKDSSIIEAGDESYEIYLQQQATFILPPLLELASSDVVNVRMCAIQWIQQLLARMDAEAASYLAAHLVRDTNPTIAGIANIILGGAITNLSPIMAEDNFTVSFIDSKESDGLAKMDNSLKCRSKELAERLQISS